MLQVSFESGNSKSRAAEEKWEYSSAPVSTDSA